MYAIIEDSGSQIKAEVGQVLTIDIRELDESATSVTFDRVLLLGGGDGESKVGHPYVEGASVTADILEREFKDKKVISIKYKRRKGHRTKQGHRQRLMRVKVSAIQA